MGLSAKGWAAFIAATVALALVTVLAFNAALPSYRAKIETRTVTVTSIVPTVTAPQACIDAIDELGITLHTVAAEMERLNERAVVNSSLAPVDAYTAWLRDLTATANAITESLPHSTNIADCRSAGVPSAG